MILDVSVGRLSSQDDLDDEASSVYASSTISAVAAGKPDTDSNEYLD
jgi:hypothetical protein